MLPQKLKIAGYNYAVKTDSTLMRDRNRIGESCANVLTITLDPTVPKQVQETTLLHEILEQVNYHYIWQDNFK